MTRTIAIWGLVLAAGAFALQWLEYQYLARVFSREIYVAVVGAACAAGGVWVGWKLTSRTAPAPFARNAAAQASLGLTGQEMKVLERLAAGQSNKEIARTLGVTPETIKTHVKRIFVKLSAESRAQAVVRAQSLGLLRNVEVT